MPTVQEQLKQLLNPEMIKRLQDPAIRRTVAQGLAQHSAPPPSDALSPEAFANPQGGGALPPSGAGPAPQLQVPVGAPPPTDPLAGIGSDIPNFGGFGAPEIRPQGRRT